jgi:hypothetical protein
MSLLTVVSYPLLPVLPRPRSDFLFICSICTRPGTHLPAGRLSFIFSHCLIIMLRFILSSYHITIPFPVSPYLLLIPPP